MRKPLFKTWIRWHSVTRGKMDRVDEFIEWLEKDQTLKKVGVILLCIFVVIFLLVHLVVYLKG